MPTHDWTRVEAGIFHDFHSAWITHLKEALNSGVLPDSYYALAEQQVGKRIADVLTLSEAPPARPAGVPRPAGLRAVLDAPPRVRRHRTIEPSTRRRTLALRHLSDHHLVAILEIVSPANKDRRESVESFAGKIEAILRHGCHALVIDLFAPGIHDPLGMPGAIGAALYRDGEIDSEEWEADCGVSADEPLTLAAYEAGPTIEEYREDLALGSPLPEMPLFLDRGYFVNVPLEPTYQAAFRGLPAYWREVLEGGCRAS